MTTNEENPLADHKRLRENWAAVKRGEVFNSLDTQPEHWHYEGGCTYQETEVQCQLCETMINYQFPLKEKEGARSLMIGRECVAHFYEAYFPNGLDIVLDMMESSFKETRKAVIAQKIEKFRTSYPQIVEFLLDRPESKMYQFRRVKVPQGDGTVTTVSTAKFRATLRRRGYLKLEEIKALQPNVDAYLAYREKDQAGKESLFIDNRTQEKQDEIDYVARFGPR